MERMRARFHALSEKSGESRRAASEVEEEIRILQAREERRGSCASQSNGWCFDPAIVEYFSRWEQHRLCSSSPSLMEKSAEYMAVNIGQSQPLRSERQEQKRREFWEEDWDDERTANGWYESAAFGSAVDPGEGSDAVGGSLVRGNTRTPRNGTRTLDSSRSQRGKRDKENDKMGDEELP